MFQYVTVFALFLCGINSQIVREGKCPDLSGQGNFDLYKFGGFWYEAERSPISFEEGGTCTKKSLTPLSNETYHEEIIQLVRESGQTRVFSGFDKLSGKPGEAKFTVNLDLGPLSRPTPYYILETDYKKYACLWSCSQIDPLTYEEIAILVTRTRNPSKTILNKARNGFDRRNISRDEFEKVDQNNC